MQWTELLTWHSTSLLLFWLWKQTLEIYLPPSAVKFARNPVSSRILICGMNWALHRIKVYVPRFSIPSSTPDMLLNHWWYHWLHFCSFGLLGLTKGYGMFRYWKMPCYRRLIGDHFIKWYVPLICGPFNSSIRWIPSFRSDTKRSTMTT